ncbi:WXG100-like domain-containing protein [Rhodococcus wratislaviensis]|uniref:WXG100-like domain-containing protein n=1 Tax=Rhodococcus wratislaviensis TaxID=44752 RepID=UPI00365DCD30
MGIEVPGGVRWLAEKVVGADWPDADETAMERLGQGWKDAGASLDDIVEEADAAMRSAMSGVDGDVDIAMAEHWARVGADGALRELSGLLHELGDTLDWSADDIRVAKLSIIAALVALAAELVAVAVASAMTFGAASPAAFAAEAATQVTVRMIIRQLITSILSRAASGAAAGAGIQAGLEAAFQKYEVHVGRRDSMDWGNVAEAGGKGAVQGGVKGAVNGAFGLTFTDPRSQFGGVLGSYVQEETVGTPRVTEAVAGDVLDRTGLDDDARRARDEIDGWLP